MSKVVLYTRGDRAELMLCVDVGLSSGVMIGAYMHK